MYRVTTPTHIFHLPFDTSGILRLILTYSQDGKTILEKTEEEVTMDENTISVTLTQEETLLFETQPVYIQFRIKMGESVLASKKLKLSVYEVLNEEVM